MKSLKNVLMLTVNQRKVLAAVMLATTFTNPAVTTSVHAEKSMTQPEAVVQTESLTIPEPAPTVQEVLLHVCEENGYGEACAKTLLGMLWTESSNRFDVIGDSGKARGYFQIHYKLHKITSDCAEDLACSANWTINYLERNSYPKYVNYAVQCHNGCNANNGYVNKVQRYAKQFWNQPLAVNQKAPIILAAE